MKKTKRNRLVTMLSLITLLVGMLMATHAQAECAWVLWIEHNVSPVDAAHIGHWFTFDQAYTSRNACMASVREWVNAAEESEAKADPKLRERMGSGVQGDTHVYYDTESKYSAETYKCYPDTIDPREPKSGR